MPARPGKGKVREFDGGVTLSVAKGPAGDSHGSRIDYNGLSFELPHWPSRISSIAETNGGLCVNFKNGRSRLLDRTDALVETAAGGSAGGHDPRGHGKIRFIIRAFGEWADGRQSVCVRRLLAEHPEVAKTPEKANALCAWMKDQWAGTTKWRGSSKDPKQVAEDKAISDKARASARARFTHSMPQITPKQLDQLVEDVQAMTGKSVNDLLSELGVDAGDRNPYEVLAEADANRAAECLVECEQELSVAYKTRDGDRYGELVETWLALHGDVDPVTDDETELREALHRLVRGSGPLRPVSETDGRVLAVLREHPPEPMMERAVSATRQVSDGQRHELPKRRSRRVAPDIVPQAQASPLALLREASVDAGDEEVDVAAGLAGVPIEDLFDVARSLYEAAGDMTRDGLAFLATAGQQTLVTTIARLCESITEEFPDSGASVVEAALADLPAKAVHAVEGMMGGECKSCGKKYKGKSCKTCAKVSEGAGCAPKVMKPGPGAGIGAKAKSKKKAKPKAQKPVKFGKSGMWEGSTDDVLGMALDAALAESKKQVHVGSYTRTTKSGKLSQVGQYSQWRVLPGTSLAGVKVGSTIKMRFNGKTHTGVVDRMKADGRVIARSEHLPDGSEWIARPSEVTHVAKSAKPGTPVGRRRDVAARIAANKKAGVKRTKRGTAYIEEPTSAKPGTPMRKRAPVEKRVAKRVAMRNTGPVSPSGAFRNGVPKAFSSSGFRSTKVPKEVRMAALRALDRANNKKPLGSGNIDLKPNSDGTFTLSADVTGRARKIRVVFSADGSMSRETSAQGRARNAVYPPRFRSTAGRRKFADIAAYVADGNPTFRRMGQELMKKHGITRADLRRYFAAHPEMMAPADVGGHTHRQFGEADES